jgi:error-prone DNA polymerase
MLTCIRKCFDLIDDHKGKRWELASVPQDDENVYDMLCAGESLGVFQVESRAQMNMLPRLKPRTSTISSSRSRSCAPGRSRAAWCTPICRRRNKPGAGELSRPAPDQGDKNELYNVLHKTLGVPLFQEQAMRIAIEAAHFTSEEANGLRRSMATFRNLGTIGSYEEKLVGNMVARGYDPDFARSCFDQIKGFGSYGFPESHAASFRPARLHLLVAEALSSRCVLLRRC